MDKDKIEEQEKSDKRLATEIMGLVYRLDNAILKSATQTEIAVMLAIARDNVQRIKKETFEPIIEKEIVLDKEVKEFDHDIEFFEKDVVDADEFLAKLYEYSDKPQEFRDKFVGDGSIKKSIKIDGKDLPINLSLVRESDSTGYVWLGLTVRDSAAPTWHILVGKNKFEGWEETNKNYLHFLPVLDRIFKDKKLDVPHLEYIHNIHSHQHFVQDGRELSVKLPGFTLGYETNSGRLEAKIKAYDFEHGTILLDFGDSVPVEYAKAEMLLKHIKEKGCTFSEYGDALVMWSAAIERFSTELKGLEIEVRHRSYKAKLTIKTSTKDSKAIPVQSSNFPFSTYLFSDNRELIDHWLSELVFHNPEKINDFEIKQLQHLHETYLKSIYLHDKLNLNEHLQNKVSIVQDKKKLLITDYNMAEQTVTLQGKGKVPIAELEKAFEGVKKGPIVQKGKYFPYTLYAFAGKVDEFRSKTGGSKFAIRIGKHKGKGKLLNQVVPNQKIPHIVILVEDFPFPVTIYAEDKYDAANLKCLEFVTAHAETKQSLKFTVDEFIMLVELYNQPRLKQTLFELEKTLPNQAYITHKFKEMHEYMIQSIDFATNKVVIHPDVYTNISRNEILNSLMQCEKAKYGFPPETYVRYLEKYKNYDFVLLKKALLNKYLRGKKSRSRIIEMRQMPSVALGTILQLDNLPPTLWVPADVHLMYMAIDIGDIRDLDKKMKLIYDVMKKEYPVKHMYHWILEPQVGKSKGGVFNKAYIESFGKKNKEWTAQGIEPLTKTEIEALDQIMKYRFVVYQE